MRAEDDPSLIGPTAEAVWSESLVMYTFVKHKGGREVNRIYECIERVLGFCPPNQDMLVLVEDQVVFDKLVHMQAASRSRFEGLRRMNETAGEGSHN
jgi:hypothetical protein